MKNITADTPVDDILGKRGDKPLMVKLAQVVFDREGLDYFRAFSQFRDTKDLAALIEAKRKNVFDYSVCIQQTDTGIKFPKNTKAIMTALGHAMDDDFDKIDFRAIGLVDADGNEVVKLNELCPGADPKAATPKPKKKPAPKPAPPKEEPKAEEKKEEPKPEPAKKPKASKPKPRPEPPTNNPEPQQAVLIGTDEVLARLDQLSSNLADALTTVVNENKKAALKKNDIIEDEIGYVKEEVEKLKAGQVALISSLHVVNENLKTVFMYIDPVEELGDFPEGAIKLIQDVVPDDLEERLSDDDDSDEVDAEQAPPEPEPAEEPEPEESDDEPEEEESSDDTVSYSRDELKAMSIDELRELAEQVGIANAANIPYKTSLVNRICKAADID